MSKLKLIQKENDEIPTEIIAQSIKDISDGIKKINNGSLNQHAIELLIQKASGGVSIRDIKNVLYALSNLEKIYLNPKKERAA